MTRADFETRELDRLQQLVTAQLVNAAERTEERVAVGFRRHPLLGSCIAATIGFAAVRLLPRQRRALLRVARIARTVAVAWLGHAARTGDAPRDVTAASAPAPHDDAPQIAPVDA